MFWLPLKTASLVWLFVLFGLASAQEQVASFPAHTRVLFQGDSITDMNRGRTSDPNHLLGHSYAFIIGAKASSSYPERGVEFVNRGISGNRVSDLEARWQVDTVDIKPDVLSILIGVNDLDSGVTENEFEANYDKLLGETESALPHVHLVLCEPFGLPTGKEKAVWETYRIQLAERQAIVAKLAQKYGAVLVQFQHVFDEACLRAPADHWIWDGIHPTFAGQQLLADEWVRTVNLAYGDPLLTPARNSAIEPCVNFERDSYDWLHRHEDVLDQQVSINPQVVMIGDSITHFWGGRPTDGRSNGPVAWQKTFAGVRVLNLGFGWDRTQNVLWRIQHGEFDGLKPQSVVLNIGTNNLVGDKTARTNTPEETVAGIVAILHLVRERCSECKIFVMAVFPRGFQKDNELDLRIRKLDSILPGALAGMQGVTLLDVGSLLREADGSVSKRILFDGTHPTEQGYAIWGKALIDAGATPIISR